MKTFYYVKVAFYRNLGGKSALDSTQRTFYVNSLSDVESVKTNAERYSYRVLGFGIEHIISPLQVAKEIGDAMAEA